MRCRRWEIRLKNLPQIVIHVVKTHAGRYRPTRILILGQPLTLAAPHWRRGYVRSRAQPRLMGWRRQRLAAPQKGFLPHPRRSITTLLFERMEVTFQIQPDVPRIDGIISTTVSITLFWSTPGLACTQRKTLVLLASPTLTARSPRSRSLGPSAWPSSKADSRGSPADFADVSADGVVPVTEGEEGEGRRAFSVPDAPRMVPRGPIGRLFGSVVPSSRSMTGFPIRSWSGLFCDCVCLLYQACSDPCRRICDPSIAGYHVGEHRSPSVRPR